MANDQIAFRGGAILFKDGKVCFSCCGGSLTDCPTDCTACGTYAVVFPTSFEIRCGEKRVTYTVPAGTYALHPNGNCMWVSDPISECFYIGLSCSGTGFPGQTGTGVTWELIGGDDYDTVRIYSKQRGLACPPRGSTAWLPLYGPGSDAYVL